MDEVWLAIAQRKSSHPLALRFLVKRLGYPLSKAQHVLGLRGTGVLKADWDEDKHPRAEDGRFTESGDSGSSGERFTASHVEGFDQAKFEEAFPGINPSDFFESLVGRDSDPKYLDVTHALNGEYQVIVRDGGTVHGHPVEYYSRIFNPEAKLVNHDYLVFKEQGAGNAKELFEKSVELYDKLGYEKIGVHAALELGAYTWSKYGFHYEDSESRLAHLGGFEGDEATSLRARLDELIPPKELQQLSSEAYDEYKDLKALMNVKDDRLNQMLVDFETPELDKETAHLVKQLSTLKEGAGFMKLLFYKTHWTGVLDLDKNGPDRKRLEAYLKSKPKTKKGLSPLDKPERTRYNTIMKSESAPKGFSTIVDGKYTDIPVMDNLLGDEPDVSKTSRDLAVELELTESVINRLGKK